MANLNGRLDRVNEKLALIESNQGDSLCLTVLSTQVKAIERGKPAIGTNLQQLADRFCPRPDPLTGMLTSTSDPLTQSEKLKEIQDANDELAKIIEKLE